MKHKIKTILSAVLAFALIIGSLFVFRKTPSVASYSYYESLKISPSSLNGNSIWGGSESFDTVVSAGGLDAWAAFYSSAQKASGGLDSSGSISIDGIPYIFSWTGSTTYDGNDTIRLYSGKTSTTVTLDTIGAYEKLYVLGTAGGPGVGNYANFAVRVNYTDGTVDETDYRLYDWYDSTAVSGVYKWPDLARRLVVTSGSTNTGWRPGQSASQVVTTDYDYEGDTTGAPYLQSATISVDSKKLVSSIDLVLTGKNDSSDPSDIYCGIYAITGMVNVAAPTPVEIIYVDNIAQTTADIFWESVDNATSYRLDIALDPDFKNILSSYNNLSVNSTELVATDLTPETTYYTRVRAENSAGQSISSNVVGFTTLETPPEPEAPEISINSNGYELGTWTNSPVTLTIEDIKTVTGETKYYYSTDAINWEEYTTPVVQTEDTSGTTYYFKAVSEEGLESEVVSALVKKDTVAPAFSDVDTEAVHYSSVDITATDNVSIASITINGEPVEAENDTITIPGNNDAVVEIVATDLAGNSSTITLTTGTLELSVSGETERWIPYDVASVSGTDAEGIEIQVSSDSGQTWETITDLGSGTYYVEENNSYVFRVISPDGSEARETLVYHNIDNITPVVEVDSHGYELGTWTNSPVTLTAKNVAPNLSPVTLYYRLAGAEEWQEYTSELFVLEDTSSTIYEFKAVSEAGLESDVVFAEVKKDSVAPTGVIFSGENSWNSFLNKVTFGLFFNNTQTFILSAEDDNSGVAQVSYLLSSTELSVEELVSSSDWILLHEREVSVDPEAEFSIYYRIVDRAGNVAFVNSDGVVLDITPPAIMGYSNGETYPVSSDETYYLSQKLLVTDNKSLQVILVNGEEVSPENGIIEIPGNTSAVVEITATDSAGNTTIFTIKTSELLSIDDLEHRNINDIPDIDDIVSCLEDLLDENPTDSERELIEEIISDHKATESEIVDTEEKVDIIEDSYSTVPTSDYVTSDEKDQIEALIEAIERVEEENGNHLTDDERQELDDMLDDLRNKLVIIEEIADKLEEVDSGVNSYDIETVTKDDLSDLEKLRDEIEELLESDNVTDEEKEHLQELLDKIDELEKRIEEAEKALEEAKNNDQTEGITQDNVRPEDQTILEDASQGYTEALGVFDTNLSITDLFDITDRISIIGSALDVLDQVAEFESLVSKLPNPNDLDFGSRAALKAAQAAYNELSEYGKSLVGPSLMAKYKALIEAYKNLLDGSPLLYAFETLDVFWWAITTFFIVGSFIIITRRTHKRYIEEDDDKF